MMPAHPNILGADPRPLFFPVADGAERIAPPEPRLGQSVRLAARSLSVMQKEGLATSSASGKVWRLVSDEGDYLDGFDEASCPLSFLTVGMVASTMTELLALVCDAAAASPLSGLMRGEKESLFTLTLNGETLAPDKALPVPGGALGDPGEVIEGAAPAESNWEGQVVKGAKSPLTEEATSSQGSSLAEEQDRVLHIRGICTLREDGVKQIEQQLFNPHGSIFTFLCDEEGRAADALSYMAAGIGFCFMTQLGRYAKIAKKDLSEYRVVQDIHFSPGGASGGTGQAGRADPVETHVFLTSNEDADFARAALDMGEQTCFLHAFCRTDLKTRVKIGRL
ncbi:OsmC family protein [Aurantiacibacter flavus]|uniref:OsmC family protein n=1 Tax=Aurantiacibacter flavus TaxID=3145232 RepID=A0ABV0CS60_9SPHN